ncbi:hypothetical protein [Terriglobus sp. ADX1]|uniref:hypothetical protein n=1 Tax=Terriglobus sp. ADX1 TaxID=2794063 RepID=UPI002FE6A162
MSHSHPHRLFPYLLAAASLLSVSSFAQQTDPQQQTAQQPPAPKGTVLFERHEEPVAPEPEQPAAAPAKPGVSSSAHPPRLRRRSPDDAAESESAPAAEPAEAVASESPSSSSGDDVATTSPLVVTEADLAAAAKVPAEARRAPLVAARDLDVHLNTHTGLAEVRAQITVKNTGAQPLSAIALQVSGALKWESARIAQGGALKLEQHHLRDDLDHTGVASEAVFTLPEALGPGAVAKLDLYYGGTIAASGGRLLELGAPSEVAVRTDWDTVTDAFTGLRGLGNVLWYPVTGDPALLKDGAAVPKAVEASRAREVESAFALHLTLEYEGAQPDAAFFCGNRQKLTSAAEGVATVSWSMAKLGPRTPSLFVTLAAPQEMAGGLVRVVTDAADRAASIGEAAARVRPMLEQWLGSKPSRPLDVIDLPIPDAAGYADGALLVAPLRTAQPAAIAPSLVVPLTSAWLPDGIDAAWLRDGIPEFMQALWAERGGDRSVALAGLAAEAKRLRQMEADAAPQISSSSSDAPVVDGPVTPLSTCTQPSCARVRAAYVLQMLRNIVGEDALQGALSGWRLKQENTPGSAEQETASFQQMVQQVAGTKKLDWFFQSWIQGTGSLPQFEIAAIAPRKIERAAAPANLLPQHQQPYGGPIGREVQAPTDDPRAHWGGDKEVAQAGSWLVAVEVQNTGGTDAEVPVTVRAGTLTNTLPLRVPAHGKATIRIPFEAEPSEVLVNDGSVPESGLALHRRSITIAPASSR